MIIEFNFTSKVMVLFVGFHLASRLFLLITSERAREHGRQVRAGGGTVRRHAARRDHGGAITCAGAGGTSQRSNGGGGAPNRTAREVLFLSRQAQHVEGAAVAFHYILVALQPGKTYHTPVTLNLKP